MPTLLIHKDAGDPSTLTKSKGFVSKESTTAANGVTTSALLLYTGTKEEIGDEDIDDELLTQIFNDTQQLLSSRRIKIFYDHKPDQENVAGVMTGQLSMRAITEADLPDFGNFQFLVGRQAIFSSGMTLTDDRAKKQYSDGTAKEISVTYGILPDNETSNLNAIREVSLVWTGALGGAHLKTLAFTIDEVIEAERVEAEQREERWEAEDAFYQAIRNIQNATDEELPEGQTREQLVEAVTSDYATRLAAALTPVPEPVNKGAKKMDFIKKALKAQKDGTVVLDLTRLSELTLEGDDAAFRNDLISTSKQLADAAKPSEESLAQKKENEELRAKNLFQSSIRRATAMVTAKQMPPVVFKSLFGESDKEAEQEKHFAGVASDIAEHPVSKFLDTFELLEKGMFGKVKREEVNDETGGDGLSEYTRKFLGERQAS